MERLAGLDAGFLAMESLAQPMHTLKLLVLEPTGSDAPDVAANLAAELAARLHLAPMLRRRVVPVPFGIHHPIFVEDDAFDLAHHLARVTVPAPGGDAELDAAVSALAAEPLDRARPLWSMTTLEGLARGRTAVLVKIHHALADGLAIAHLLPSLFGPDAATPAAAWAPEPVPSRWSLFGAALRDQARQAWALPGLVVRTGTHALRLLGRADARSSLPFLDAADRSAGPTSGRRSFASGVLSLPHTRAVAHAHGATITDVVLAIVGGALRRDLADRGPLPARSLLASVPTSAEADGERHRAGNRVSSLFVPLGTDEPDGVVRLARIRDATLRAKESQRLLGAELLGAWAAYALPAVVGLVFAAWSEPSLAPHVRPAVNAIVSSVPGPRTALLVPGHRVAAIYSVGPVLAGSAINVTVWSYLDALHVGVLVSPEHFPRPHALVAGMAAELDALGTPPP